MPAQCVIQTTLKTFEDVCSVVLLRMYRIFIFTFRKLKRGKTRDILHTRNCSFAVGSLRRIRGGSTKPIALINIAVRNVIAFIDKDPILTSFLNYMYSRKIVLIFFQMLRRETLNTHALVTSIRIHLHVKL